MTEEPQDADRPTMTPFLGALAIIVLVVIGISVSSLFRGDELSEDQQVGRAVAGQNDAMQRENFADFTGYTCREQQGSEADFLTRQQDSVAKQGARYIDGVTEVQIDGDRATATVVSHFKNAPDTKIRTATDFVREDGAWKVCSGMGDSRP